jgi:hypothetical protein
MKHYVRVCLILVAFIGVCPTDAAAHHVLGRPAYSLNEDSNTPSSMQAEIRIEDYLVTYMAFPAFPKPQKQGRINLYVVDIEDGTPYSGKVTFRVREDTLLSKLGFSTTRETLGVQPPDDNVFRQGFRFHEAGNYMVSAEFLADGELYFIDFPLRVGDPPWIGPIGAIVALSIFALITVSVVQGRRAMIGRIRDAQHRRKERP